MLDGGPLTILRARLALSLAIGAIALGGCATSSYAGVPLSPGAADADLQQLAYRARAGDKHAQLELGKRYEEGRGLHRHLGRAIRLYRLASTPSGGQVWIYSPPVLGSPGTVVPFYLGPREPGLIEAATRLTALKQTRKGR